MSIGVDTYLRIRAIYEDALMAYEREVKVYAIIRLLLEKFRGKRVDTKRTLTHIQNAQPTWTVGFHRIASQTYIRVYGGDSGYRDYDDSTRVFLGYDNEMNDFDPAQLQQRNPSIVSCMVEAEACKLMLQDEKSLEVLAYEIDSFKNHQRKFDEMLKSAPQNYSLRKLAEQK